MKKLPVVLIVVVRLSFTQKKYNLSEKKKSRFLGRGKKELHKYRVQWADIAGFYSILFFLRLDWNSTLNKRIRVGESCFFSYYL